MKPINLWGDYHSIWFSEQALNIHPGINWIGEYVFKLNDRRQLKINIKREFYKTMRSKLFDFGKDEKRQLFTCSITIPMSMVDQSQITINELIDKFAPHLKKE